MSSGSKLVAVGAGMPSRVALAAVLLLAVGGWDWLTSPDPDVDAGNQAFDAGKFDEALGLYQRAEKTTDSEAAIRFDAGAALYRLAESAKDQDKRAQLLDRAESAFREATDTSDEILKSAAFHNLGNAMFQRQRWPQAKDAYKKALKANQDNDDARYNLELVLEKEKRDDKSSASSRGQPKNPDKNQGQGQQQKPQGGDGGDDAAADPDGSQGPQSGGAGQQTQDDQAGAGDDESDQAKPGQGQKSGDPSAGQSQPAPNPGQGAPQDQPSPGQGPKGPQAPGSAGGQSDPAGGNAEADLEPGEGESMTDRDRKLDALENRSRDLRRRRFRRGASGPRTREGNVKDW